MNKSNLHGRINQALSCYKLVRYYGTQYTLLCIITVSSDDAKAALALLPLENVFRAKLKTEQVWFMSKLS